MTKATIFDAPEFYPVGLVMSVHGPLGTYEIRSEGERCLERHDKPWDKILRTPADFRSEFPHGKLPEDDDECLWVNNGWFSVCRAGSDQQDALAGSATLFYSLHEAYADALDQAFGVPLYVTVYEMDRVYGGPEEGGWWYDTGTVVCSEVFQDQAMAEGRAKELREEYPSTDRRSSVVYRGGDYEVYIETTPPQDFPEHRPHYE